MENASWALRRATERARGIAALAATVLAAVLACVLVPAAAHAAGPMAGAARVGTAAPGASVALALPLKANVSGLERFAAAVSTPGSSQYGHYASIAALANRFGAPGGERTRVMSYLRRAGATGVKVDATGLFADATMKVGEAQRLFGTTLGDYRTARAARFIAPSAPTRIPAALGSSVTGVVGLDTQPVFGSRQIQTSTDAAWPRAAAAAPARETADDESGYAERTGTPSGCRAAVAQSGFTPNQYLEAYNYTPLQSSGIRGQGERVALIEIDGFRYSDLHAFANCFSLATPAINGYGVGLEHPLTPGGESTLDLEVLDAAAPDLKAVDVYESRPSAVAVLHSLTAPLSDPARKPDVISASLGACEQATRDTIGSSGLRTVQGSLALAAASGISVLASSGDDGSSSCLTRSGRPWASLAVSYPASSPWVTGVGGTNFSLNLANQITGQQVWNDAPLVVAAGGGGLSSLFDRPFYQRSFVTPNRRAVPDVSMLADVAPGYEIYCTAPRDCITPGHSSPWNEVGGTSAAAPLLAGGLALVDQDLRIHGRQNVGLANPLLYKIAHSPLSPNVLSDVVSNNNDLGASIMGKPFGCCTAIPGFDDASGLGSVNLDGLALAAGSLVPKIASIDISLPGQRDPVANEQLLARVSCSQPCLMQAVADIQIGRSPTAMTEQSSPYLLRRGGLKTVRISLSRTTLTAVRAALVRRTPVTATVYGALLDPGGALDARTGGRRLPLHG